MESFNLRREANPLATTASFGSRFSPFLFQSQARSQSPGDEEDKETSLAMLTVSISGEKPIPWRHTLLLAEVMIKLSFNLRREANPLATAATRIFCSSLYWVSISGEKPIPWRQQRPSRPHERHQSFNLRREANPLAT